MSHWLQDEYFLIGKNMNTKILNLINMVFSLVSISFIGAMESPQQTRKNEMRRQSALGAATRQSNLPMVRKILQEGPLDVNFSEPIGVNDASGNMYFDLTPLMWAAHHGHQQIVELLLKAGARADLKNPAGLTAYDIAIAVNHPEIAKLIKEKTSLRYPSLREQALHEVSKLEGGPEFIEQMKESLPASKEK